jgi:undecaprenyl-diphosphatase
MQAHAIAAVRRFDAAVERRVEQVRSPLLDRVFYPLSTAADHSRLWHGIAAVDAVLHPTRVADSLRLAVALGAESLATNVVVKSAFRRVRPDEPTEWAGERPPYGMRRPITSSFPSGHAAAAMTAAVLLSAARPRRAPVVFGLAALVASSRVYVRMHHASDVLAGAAWGLAFGVGARRALRRVGGA